MEFDSVQQWLCDLEDRTETECMSVLQGKPLPTTRKAEPAKTLTVNWKDGLINIQNQAITITTQFDCLYRCLDDEKWDELSKSSNHVTCQIRTLIQSMNENIPQSPQCIIQQQEQVIGECAKLAQKVESIDPTLCKDNLVNQITCLGESFTQLIDLLITHLIQLMIDDLQIVDNSAIYIQNSINSIINLCEEGEHWCILIAQSGGVKALLTICLYESVKFAHVQSLRALSCICCLPDIISELEKENGFSLLLEILCNDAMSENVKGEAAGVLAQVTSPAIEHNYFIGELMDNLQDLIHSLIRLCCESESQEIFLLASAAIANLTFIDSMACDILASICAPEIFILSMSTDKAQTLFAKDQIATILANMAASDEYHDCISRPGGVCLLVDFLSISPTAYKTDSEIAACERVLQKAAIALTRLCRVEQNAQDIVENCGVPRFIELCRLSSERCHSDAVLVASLAALRKVCATCGSKGIESLDVQQLIEPRLMDSFVMCSHSDENFV